MSGAEQKRIRLLLVDDHEVVRIGLRTLLSRIPDFEVVSEAQTMSEAVAQALASQPEVILLDVRLPDGSGFEACREIQKSLPEARFIILTSYADDNLLYEAISAGADGYLLKEIDGEGLVRAIHDVASGKSILDPAVTSRVFTKIKSLSESGEKDKLDLLSGQERRVLSLVAEGKTNKEIGLELGLSDKTVKNYLSNVLDKLKLSRRSQAAAFFVQHTNR